MIYVTWAERDEDRARVLKQFHDPWPGLTEVEPNGFYVEKIPDPNEKSGFYPVLMVKFSADAEPELYYDYRAIPEPEESQLQKAQARIAELESKTKLLEYNAQNMGETLDVHEGAIVDVMNLALGTPPNEL